MTRPWITGAIELADGQLRYHRTGGDGPVMLLAHGLTDSGLCWTRLVLALETDFDLVMLDARGHGMSSRVVSGVSHDPAEDIAAAIRGLKLRAPILIGHSVGGRAVAECAGRDPGMISTVILEDPVFLDWPSDVISKERRQARFRNQVAELKLLSEDELLALGQRRHPTWSEDEFAAWVDSKRQADPEALPNYATPWRDVVSSLRTPTLLIHGEEELGSMITPTIAEEARGLSGFLSTQLVPGAGHNVRREAFEAYLATIKAFLSQGRR